MSPKLQARKKERKKKKKQPTFSSHLFGYLHFQGKKNNIILIKGSKLRISTSGEHMVSVVGIVQSFSFSQKFITF